MFARTSYFDQVAKASEKAAEAQKALLSDLAPMTPSPPDPHKARIASWANDLNDCLNQLAGVDTGRYGAKSFEVAMERIDEIVREMDEYGTTG